MTLWTEKYAPKSLDEIVGNAEALQTIRGWALDWQRGKGQKPLLLHGPPGVGKTACARALAEEMDWGLLETNASDLRDSNNVKKLLGLAAVGGSLFGNKRLVLVDEVDAAFDRGGVPALVKVLEEASQPIVLTANDVWVANLAPVRSLCARVEFKRVSKSDVKKLLEKIASLEKTIIPAEVIENAGGDVRSALIDLQAREASEREREQNIFESIKKVFKTETFEEAVSAQNLSAVDLDFFIRWIEENIPTEYEQADDAARAFDWLSRASLFSSRVARRQIYSLLRFVRVAALAGVAFSKREPYRKFTAYQFPNYVRLLSQSKKNRSLSQSAWRKAAAKLHCSTKKVKEHAWAYARASKYFDWTEEEVSVAAANYPVPNSTSSHSKEKPKNIRR